MRLTERAEICGLSEREAVARGLGFVTPELAAEPGAERLRAWAARGCPPADRDALRYVGDAHVADLVRAALRRIPDPVVDYLVRTTVVIGIGREAVGYFVPSFPIDPAPAVIVIDARGRPDAHVEATVAHEASHAWRAPEEPRSWNLSPTLASPGATADARTQRRTPALEEYHRREEWYATTLARQWGFTGPAADPGPWRASRPAAMSRNIDGAAGACAEAVDAIADTEVLMRGSLFRIGEQLATHGQALGDLPSTRARRAAHRRIRLARHAIRTARQKLE
jgi:hypothetical protein